MLFYSTRNFLVVFPLGIRCLFLFSRADMFGSPRNHKLIFMKQLASHLFVYIITNEIIIAGGKSI
jgi:hypothetical protein